MKMKKISIIMLLVLSGCDINNFSYWDKLKPMTNQQIIQGINYCTSKGFRFDQRSNSRNETVKIECWKSEQ